jgi:hypothetical protein
MVRRSPKTTLDPVAVACHPTKSDSCCFASPYDAEFVALAEERGLRLVTNDRVLLQRTPAISILPEEFLKQR